MIKKFCYSFKQPITMYQASELNKKIWYLSELLHDYQLQYDGEKCVGIKVNIEESAYESFKNYLCNILKNDIYELKNISTEVLWSHQLTKDISEDTTMHLLQQNNLVHIHGEGQVSLKYPLTELFEFFDVILKYLSVQIFSAEQYIFPTLIKSSVLGDAGYFDSFPNLWNFVSRLHNDYTTFSDFKTENCNMNPNIIQKMSVVTGYSLPPTMCYYVYDMLSESIISNATVTTRGKSFRYENNYCKNMSRLWDFTIRETVFLGSKEYVNQSLEKYRLIAILIMDLLELAGKCVYANDPFYLANNAAKRINVQRMNHSKAELRLNISNDETIAIASFNRHNQYITKRFRLYINEQHDLAYTSCIGFGLERMVFAFLCQYGIKENDWPNIVKDNYKKKNKEEVAIEILNDYIK